MCARRVQITESGVPGRSVDVVEEDRVHGGELPAQDADYGLASQDARVVAARRGVDDQDVDVLGTDASSPVDVIPPLRRGPGRRLDGEGGWEWRQAHLLDRGYEREALAGEQPADERAQLGILLDADQPPAHLRRGARQVQRGRPRAELD